MLIAIIDLYVNYNETYFPEYHEKRVKFNIICLFIYFNPFFLIIFAIFCGCCLCIYIIVLIILAIASFYYLISSFYLYFAYDGANRIKNPVIRIFLWITFLSFVINIISCIFARKSNKKDLNIEFEEERNYRILNDENQKNI